MYNYAKYAYRRQRKINQIFAFILATNLMIIFTIMLITIVGVSRNNQIEGESQTTAYESEYDNHNDVTLPANTPYTEDETTKVYCRNLSENDKLMLAKIAMAEAEGESINTKIFVILTVLNRVESENPYFPDTVKEVIFQNNDGVYQFSPIVPGGRYWTTEPTKECWEAVEIVNYMEDDISEGALYFEACSGESWHSRNLEFLFESDGVKFYK